MTEPLSSSAPQPQTNAPASVAATSLDAAIASGAVVLPVIEERAIINREVVESGRVRITRQVHESDELIRVPLQHDEVRVERVAVNQYLPAGAPVPPTRYEGEVMVIPVLREVAVVEKRLLLVEELRVTKHQVTTEHTEPMHLRREDFHVERISTLATDPTNNTAPGPTAGPELTQ
jgi:uncharacterized protein (TIGR02271 family)